jgi:hypothetical protein
MDKAEARSILAAELEQLRSASYSDLMERLLDNEESLGRVGASGTRYTVEIRAFWDGEPQGNLRVRAMIDDGGWRSFAPLVEDFIRAPARLVRRRVALYAPVFGNVPRA